MKSLLAVVIAMVAASAAPAEVHWFYFIEQIPASLPGASLEPAGIMVYLDGAHDATVCVDYTVTASGASQRACAAGTKTEVIRINLGATSADFSVDGIAVTAGGGTKFVRMPVPGVEY